MKKTLVAAVTLSIVIVVTLLTGIACSSQSSSGGLPADTSSDNSKLEVLTQTLTCASPSDIRIISKGLKSSGATWGGWVTGVIQNSGKGTFTGLQVYADCNYSKVVARIGWKQNESNSCSVAIGPGETAEYEIWFSSWANDLVPTSYDVYVGGDYETHLTGKVKIKGPNVREFYGLEARFYDAHGNIISGTGIALTQGSETFSCLMSGDFWAGDIVDYDIAFSSKTQPVRYDLRIE